MSVYGTKEWMEAVVKAITAMSIDTVAECSYYGFDLAIALSTFKTKLHDKKIPYDDVIFLVIVALMRGNNIEAIKKKSSPKMKKRLMDLQTKMGILARGQGSEDLTLVRLSILNPDISYSLLNEVRDDRVLIDKALSVEEFCEFCKECCEYLSIAAPDKFIFPPGLRSTAILSIMNVNKTANFIDIAQTVALYTTKEAQFFYRAGVDSSAASRRAEYQPAMIGPKLSAQYNICINAMSNTAMNDSYRGRARDMCGLTDAVLDGILTKCDIFAKIFSGLVNESSS